MKKKNLGNFPEKENIFENDAKESILKQLIFLGQAKSEVIIGNMSFVLTTLTEENYRDLVTRVLKLNDSGKVIAARGLSIAASLKTINGISFDSLIIDKMREEGLEETEEEVSFQKVKMILTMQSNTITLLYDEFEKLNKKSLTEVQAEEVKK